MELTFKRAASDDLDEILIFMRGLYQFDHIALDETAARTALTNLIANESFGRVWLIYSEGEAIGYVVLTLGYSLEFHGRDAFIDELYVRESHRGRGVGMSTIKFVEEACRALGVEALHLEVERDNTRAQGVYRKAGFADHDRYLLTKWLAPLDAGEKPH